MGIYSRWFTCGFSLRGHRRHIRLFFDTFDFLSRWRLSVNNPSVRGVFRTLSPRGQVYEGNFGGPEPRRRALNVALEINPGDWRWLASVSPKFADFRKFLRSQPGDIALQSLFFLNICSCERKYGEERVNRGIKRARVGCQLKYK